MRSLSANDQKTRDDYIRKFEELKAKLEEKIEAYNEVASEAYREVESAQAGVASLQEEVGSWLNSLAADAESYYDEKSEKWQESDKGQAYGNWVEELRNAEGEVGYVVSVSDFEELEVPSEIDDTIEALNNVPSEPEEC